MFQNRKRREIQNTKVRLRLRYPTSSPKCNTGPPPERGRGPSGGGGPVLRDFPARAPDSTRNTAAVPSDRSVTGPPGGGRAPRREVARPSGRGKGWPDRNRAGAPAEFPLPRRPMGRRPVGVPVKAPLPRVVGRREEEVGLQRLRHLRVPRELPAVARRDRVDPGAGTLGKVSHRPADHRVRFPVADPRLRHDLRPALLRQLPRDRRGPVPVRRRLPPLPILDSVRTYFRPTRNQERRKSKGSASQRPEQGI